MSRVLEPWELSKQDVWRDFLVHYGLGLGRATEEELVQEVLLGDSEAHQHGCSPTGKMAAFELVRRGVL